MSLYPGIKVELISIPVRDYQNKLSIMVASKTAPDVVTLTERMIPQFIHNEDLVDLTEFRTDPDYDLQDILPSMLEIYEQHGGLYGIPFSVGPRPLFFNKSLFKEKGLKTPLELLQEGRWTYEEMAKLAKQLSDSSKGIYGIRLFPDWKNWANSLIDLIWAYGADVFDRENKRFVLNSPEGIQALEYYSRLVFKDKSHVKPGEMISFESGKLAMYRDNPAYMATARNIKDFDWDIAPMPSGPKADAPLATGLAGYSVIKDSPHMKEAVLFVKYMTSKQGMTDQLDWFIPPRKSVLESDTFLSQAAPPSPEGLRQTIIEPIKTRLRVIPNHYRWQEIDTKMQSLFDLVQTGERPIPEILAQMEIEVGPLLKSEE